MQYSFITASHLYNMSEISPEQKKYLIGRKAARICAALVIFGGAVITLLGVAFAYWPEFTQGVVLMTSSVPLFVLARYCEKKLSLPKK